MPVPDIFLGVVLNSGIMRGIEDPVRGPSGLEHVAVAPGTLNCELSIPRNWDRLAVQEDNKIAGLLEAGKGTLRDAAECLSPGRVIWRLVLQYDYRPCSFHGC